MKTITMKADILNLLPEGLNIFEEISRFFSPDWLLISINMEYDNSKMISLLIAELKSCSNNPEKSEKYEYLKNTGRILNMTCTSNLGEYTFQYPYKNQLERIVDDGPSHTHGNIFLDMSYQINTKKIIKKKILTRSIEI